MGSIHDFRRKPPRVELPATPAPQPSTEEDFVSVRILLWTFAAAAIVMCISAVACFADSWTHLFWISAFVLVFALAKIGLANALFVIMIRYDRDRRPPPPIEPQPRPSRHPRPQPASSVGRRYAGRRLHAALKPIDRPQAPGGANR